LGAIKTITVHYRVSKSLKDHGYKLDYEEFKKELKRNSKEPEKPDDPVVPPDRLDHTNLYNTLGSNKRALKKHYALKEVMIYLMKIHLSSIWMKKHGEIYIRK